MREWSETLLTGILNELQQLYGRNFRIGDGGKTWTLECF